MGFLTCIFSSVIKITLTPVAIVKDAVNVVTGEDAYVTKSLIESAAEDVMDAADNLCDGEFL
ncbi:MAG TPA: hypothetical protein PKD00_05330 [Burkholderiales bacterium]|mgnify:CR=1 FL=1|nr:hypothetical protein [Burkholderiales bacterium]